MKHLCSIQGKLLVEPQDSGCCSCSVGVFKLFSDLFLLFCAFHISCIVFFFFFFFFFFFLFPLHWRNFKRKKKHCSLFSIVRCFFSIFQLQKGGFCQCQFAQLHADWSKYWLEKCTPWSVCTLLRNPIHTENQFWLVVQNSRPRWSLGVTSVLLCNLRSQQTLHGLVVTSWRLKAKGLGLFLSGFFNNAKHKKNKVTSMWSVSGEKNNQLNHLLGYFWPNPTSRWEFLPQRNVNVSRYFILFYFSSKIILVVLSTKSLSKKGKFMCLPTIKKRNKKKVYARKKKKQKRFWFVGTSFGCFQLDLVSFFTFFNVQIVFIVGFYVASQKKKKKKKNCVRQIGRGERKLARISTNRIFTFDHNLWRIQGKKKTFLLRKVDSWWFLVRCWGNFCEIRKMDTVTVSKHWVHNWFWSKIVAHPVGNCHQW